jgi:ferric-chelate reductase
MTGLSFQKFVWPSFVVWGLDRSIRLLRVLVFTFSSPRSPQQSIPEAHDKHSHLSAAVTSQLELVSSDIIRLTILRPRHFHWSPGQNVYLTIPETTRFLPEAHPFTIATIKYEEHGSHSNQTELELVEKSTRNVESNSDSDLVFFINVRSGCTRRLAGQTSFDSKKNNLKVFVDGPYGSPPDLRVFDTCVLLAGECVFIFAVWRIQLRIIARWYGCGVHASTVP